MSGWRPRTSTITAPSAGQRRPSSAACNSEAVSVRIKGPGNTVVTDGPYMESKEHIGGFWVLECASRDEAIEWGRRAAIACRAPVEVRPSHE